MIIMYTSPLRIQFPPSAYTILYPSFSIFNLKHSSLPSAIQPRSILFTGNLGEKIQKNNRRRLSNKASENGPQVEVHEEQIEKDVFSVWALPPEDVRQRLKKLMDGLRSEFGGPDFEPHVTVFGAISLTESDARDKFKKACEGLKAYDAIVEKVATGTFFYQCVFLLLHPTPEILEASVRCTSHFGYKSSTPYMPHLSLLYGDLTEEEKMKAQEKANILDESISSLSFPISRLALYKTDTEDKTLKSWQKVAECNLDPK